jgi:hypothetical protein
MVLGCGLVCMEHDITNVSAVELLAEKFRTPLYVFSLHVYSDTFMNGR